MIVTTVGDVAAGSPIQARGPLASLSSTMGKISLASGRIDEARQFLLEARVVNIGHPDCGALAESLRRATEGK